MKHVAPSGIRRPLTPILDLGCMTIEFKKGMTWSLTIWRGRGREGCRGPCRDDRRQTARTTRGSNRNSCRGGAEGRGRGRGLSGDGCPWAPRLGPPRVRRRGELGAKAAWTMAAKPQRVRPLGSGEGGGARVLVDREGVEQALVVHPRLAAHEVSRHGEARALREGEAELARAAPPRARLHKLMEVVERRGAMLLLGLRRHVLLEPPHVCGARGRSRSSAAGGGASSSLGRAPHHEDHPLSLGHAAGSLRLGSSKEYDMRSSDAICGSWIAAVWTKNEPSARGCR